MAVRVAVTVTVAVAAALMLIVYFMTLGRVGIVELIGQCLLMARRADRKVFDRA